MAADEMPLMLDNAMSVDLNDVDDLFGDDVALSLPVRSQGKQLQQRLDELRSRGCAQYDVHLRFTASLATPRHIVLTGSAGLSPGQGRGPLPP
jgi:hypothetical protein